MQKDPISLLPAVIVAASLIGPAFTQARANISIRNDRGDTCESLDVSSSGFVARAAQTYTLPAASSLEIDGGNRGHIRVRGGTGAEYTVQACRITAADTQAAADQALPGVAVNRSGSRFSVTGSGSGEWLVYFIVQTPARASLDLETHNGPISVANVAGNIKARAANGPIAVHDCDGDIQVRSTNGPVSFAGSGGNVSLNAQNGPVSVSLSGSDWKGQGLDARAVNGPVSLHLPDTYHTGIRIETSGHAPFACSAGLCGQMVADTSGSQRVFQLNGSSAVVRLSTHNGPVAIASPSKGPRMI